MTSNTVLVVKFDLGAKRYAMADATSEAVPARPTGKHLVLPDPQPVRRAVSTDVSTHPSTAHRIHGSRSDPAGPAATVEALTAAGCAMSVGPPARHVLVGSAMLRRWRSRLNGSCRPADV